MYKIKAIPTRYSGVQFRSRLEARWAAFFDLCEWQWDYEPVDLNEWCPDFCIQTSCCPVMAEVKPVEYPRFEDAAFQKATMHWMSVQVLLLGMRPVQKGYGSIGLLADTPEGAAHHWHEVMSFLRIDEADQLWREAGNIVQWKRGG